MGYEKRLPRKKDICLSLALSALPFAFFWRATLGIELLGDHDTFAYFLPQRILLADLLRSRQLPLWNPYANSGMPLLGDVQSAILYPFNWLFALIPFAHAHNLIIIAHHSIAAAGTYLFCRSCALREPAAFASAVIYSFSSFLVYNQANLGVMLAASWLPAVFLAISSMKERPAFRFVLLGSATFALSILAGFPQISFYIALAAIGYIVYCALFEDEIKSKARFVLASASILPIGLMIAGPQLIPTWELARLSLRGELSYQELSIFSLPFLDILASMISRYLYFLVWIVKDDPQRNLAALNLGLVPAALIIYAVARRPARKETWFWIAALLAAISISTGKYNPLNRLLFSAPPLNIFRVPSRSLVVGFFAASVLVGYGLDALWRSSKLKPKRTLSVKASFPLCAIPSLTILILLYNEALHGGHTVEKFFKVIFDEALRPSDIFGASALANFAIISIAIIASEAALIALLMLNFSSRWAKFGLIIAMAGNFPIAGAINHLNMDRKHIESLVKAEPPAFAAMMPDGSKSKPFRVGAVLNLSILSYKDWHKIYSDMALPRFSAVHGLQSSEGYGPFTLKRYGELMGAKTIGLYEYGLHDDYEIYSSGSQAANLLSIKYIAALKKGLLRPPAKKYIQGVGFEKNMRLGLKSGESYTFMALSIEAKEIAIISTIGGRGNLRQGEAFALVEAELAGGGVARKQLLAGIDSADWDIDRPSPAESALHKKAPVAEDYPSPPEIFPGYLNHSYFALFPLDAPVRINRLTIRYTAKEGMLWVFKLSLVGADGASYPLSKTYSDLSSNSALAKIYEDGNMTLYENKAALPRAWLVEEVAWVKPGESEEILRTGNFKDGSGFDPSKVALVEEFDEELSRLRPARLREDEIVSLEKFSPNSLEIQAKTSAPRLLVASEIFYPGWLVYVDGKRAKIHRVNSILRGVLIGEGSHKVVFKYRPKSFYAGLALFGAAIAMLTAIKRVFRKTSLSSAIEPAPRPTPRLTSPPLGNSQP